MDERVRRLIESGAASPEAKLRLRVLIQWCAEEIDTEQACRILGLSEPGLWALHDQAMAALVEACSEVPNEDGPPNESSAG